MCSIQTGYEEHFQLRELSSGFLGLSGNCWEDADEERNKNMLESSSFGCPNYSAKMGGVRLKQTLVYLNGDESALFKLSYFGLSK
jgi:hypothetical protein